MTDDNSNDDLKIEISEQVRAKLEADPKLKAAAGDLLAAFHQAADAVKRGQYASFDDAVEAITGCRPEAIDADGYVVPGVSMHHELGFERGGGIDGLQLFKATRVGDTPDDARAVDALMQRMSEAIGTGVPMITVATAAAYLTAYALGQEFDEDPAEREAALNKTVAFMRKMLALMPIKPQGN